MSLWVGLLQRSAFKLGSPAASLGLEPGLMTALGGVRGKKIKASGSTKNVAGHPTGKKRGVKVFDGQRVQIGTRLAMLRHLDILPGWNVVSRTRNLFATCHGRVMITTEVCDPGEHVDLLMSPTRHPFHKYDADKGRVYRLHLHIIPDEQHQYFKLTEQV
eukprot:maker-scaffold1518_size37722-snap-gene-0.13 protein:Tk01678 transcript:maker-scaffold1518_size37722-snap-gene-0.13-mRNA-1 annotation:"39s ribosomal protein mitochondrial"